VTETAPRVLVLDDEAIVVERLSEALSRAGLEVEGFTDGASALRALRENPFGVVVTDLKMRPPTGMDVILEVRRMRPEARIVVITGYADRETFEQMRRLGVAAFVAKPFRLKDVVDKVLDR
jgi:DNA-binding NtrC family response regulator